MTYRYKGAKALVNLHETHLRSCLACWREAKQAKLQLPNTNDTDYDSLEHLLMHILRAARGYMTWICEQLELPDPKIHAVPNLEIVEQEAEAFLEHLLERWRLPLMHVEEKHFYHPSYTSRWGPVYCIDAMLEHAVMHPIRHEYQLRNLLDRST